jgi:hypothetical protein
MPEGAKSASGQLQFIVDHIFKDLGDWIIVIFDNILIGAETLELLQERLKLVLKRSHDYNVALKMAKSHFGVQQLTFFGYSINGATHTISMSDERIQDLQAIPMPRNLKQLKSFLGAAGFLSSFVPDFSKTRAALDDMTKKGFDWNNIDPRFEEAFQLFKDNLVRAVELHIVDFSLPMILEVDGRSNVAVSAVLYQVKDGVRCMLGFASCKLTETQIRWAIGKIEAFAFLFGFKKFSYWLS